MAVNEALRNSLSVILFCFEILMVKSFRALICLSVDGAYRLVAELDQECFVSDHWPIFVLAIVIIAGIGVLIPVCVFVTGWRDQRGLQVSNIAFALYEVFRDPYEPRVWWFGPVSLIAVQCRQSSDHPSSSSHFLLAGGPRACCQ
jgi:hypothetical protein